MNAETNIQYLLSWIQRHTPERLSVLIPISGGTDSGLCFWAYNQVVPERVVGIHIGGEFMANDWLASIGTVRNLALSPALPDAEVMRWAQLLQLSLDENRLLVGTRNRTEDVLGIFSNASRIAAHLPLAGLWKSEILAMCEHISMPAEVVRASKQADPVCGRPEELAQIPFDCVDDFLKEKLGEAHTSAQENLSPAQRNYLESVYAKHSFKRVLPVKGS